MKTFDLVLSYYDNPVILKNWLHRLIYHSDFKKFEKRAQIIISDSGTPLSALENSIEVVEEAFKLTNFKWTYLRSETEELRKLVPLEYPSRMMNHAFNNVVFEFSQSDVMIISMIGFIFSPDYFSGHVAEHLKSDRVVVLPRRFDLLSEEYHDKYVDESWTFLMENGRSFINPSGGWPDMSVRIKWLREIGGWDEWYQFIAPIDMDLGSRLTGKLDNGQPSEMLYPEKGPYNNLGLEFVQPFRQNFISLTCNTYKGHIPSTKRKLSYEHGIKYYLDNWGLINRNQDRIPTKFEIVAKSQI